MPEPAGTAPPLIALDGVAVAFARLLRRRGVEVTVEASVLYGEALAAELKEPAVNLIGALSLKETMATVAQLRLMIGADTGLMHIAAAVGCPTITAFARTPATKWGHNYSPHHVLVAPGQEMSELDAETYLDAARRVLEPR